MAKFEVTVPAFITVTVEATDFHDALALVQGCGYRTFKVSGVAGSDEVWDEFGTAYCHNAKLEDVDAAE